MSLSGRKLRPRKQNFLRLLLSTPKGVCLAPEVPGDPGRRPACLEERRHLEEEQPHHKAGRKGDARIVISKAAEKGQAKEGAMAV